VLTLAEEVPTEEVIQEEEPAPEEEPVTTEEEPIVEEVEEVVETPVEEETVQEEPLDGEAGTTTDDGVEGEDGDIASTTPTEEEPAVIVTGGATSTADTENVVNLNTTDTDGGETATSTPVETGTSTPALGGVASTTVENTNEAVVENIATSTAETGDNAATSSAAVIETGDAVANANIINVVNVNIVNSLGFLVLLSALFGNDSFDLRNLDFSSWLNSDSTLDPEEEEGTTPCSLVSCNEEGTALTVTSSSTAQITNDVVVRADTGGNTASAEAGDAVVQTGDAYAGANVVNVANTNIIDSNYLLVALNNFGDFSGDIVFPGMDFFLQLLGKSSSVAPDVSVTNENTANVENDVSVSAETGDNNASSTNTAGIATGDASASANVVNQVNSNLSGGNSLYILLRIHGDWSGDVFGLPPGLSWAKTAQGIEIYSTGEEGETQPPKYQSLVVNNTNDADIKNNVSVYALTGENNVSATGGDAVVQTGDAHAAANVVNVANTNVVGQNWILAVFNIFGDWSGNLSFGRPNLWVGGRAESPSDPLTNGSDVTYHFTVTNFGDAEATGVVLDSAYTEGLLNFGDNGTTWEIGDLAPGETKEVSYHASVTDNLNYGETSIVLETTALSNENDDDKSDNTETIAMVGYRKAPANSSASREKVRGYDSARLRITKEAAVLTTAASSTVDYTVVITNTGDEAEQALLLDELTDQEGEIVSVQQWDLGTIYPDEEITITYTAVFNESTLPGEYINSAQVLATDERSQQNSRYTANSNVAQTTVTVVDALGQCAPYLTTYIRPGLGNDRGDVERLQMFLRDHEGFDNLAVTGIYNAPTADAVKIFQEKHVNEILTPWGISSATGYVYYTTQKKINDLHCAGEVIFTLSPEQQAEIANFRARQERGEDPDPSEVGSAEQPVIAKEDEQEEALGVPKEPVVRNVGSVIQSGITSRLFKIFSDTFGDLTSWVTEGGMFQSRK
jgi:hypothetical protein